MIKRQLYMFLVINFVGFCLPFSTFGEEKWSGALLNIDCNSWSTYEEDWAHDTDKFLREKGFVLTNKEYELEKRKAHENKIAFIQGMMDAYNRAYGITHNKKFLLTYKVGVYKLEIDAFCEKSENKDKFIAESVLIVNRNLKSGGK